MMLLRLFLLVLLLAGCAGSVRPDPAPQAVGPGLAAGLAVADSLVAAAVGTLAPGAVLVVSHRNQVVFEKAYGSAQRLDDAGALLPAPPPMTTGTLFDLASVTKVMATTLAVMRLVDEGKVDLDAPVARYLPAFTGPRLDSITVRRLLNHSSGLVQWQPLYYAAATPAEAFDAIRAMPLGWRVGEGRHYSDLGFMLLGYLVERVSGQPLDAYVARTFYEPLGLRATGFTPRRRGFTTFAATERGNAYEHHMVFDSTFGYRYAGDPEAWTGWREHVLVGEVNDGNAFYAHGGVAGHAGLFSTARDLRVLLDLLLAGGTYDGRRYLREETIQRFLQRDAYGHYLGWQAPRDLPEGSFAHSGFTGTYVLAMPAYDLSVVLLTNRQQMGTDERGYFPNVGPLDAAIARILADGAARDAGAGR